ncbi:MAG: membrane-anchored glycerophosphoryl diester phosphodiesterase (GDPDase) [Oleiphilaceae bacterium]|jgi:membrane-anchored glycerophosphoryl diester phosphodiesterase (GDPDase)
MNLSNLITRDNVESYLLGVLLVILVAFVETSLTTLILSCIIAYLYEQITALRKLIRAKD